MVFPSLTNAYDYGHCANQVIRLEEIDLLVVGSKEK